MISIKKLKEFNYKFYNKKCDNFVLQTFYVCYILKIIRKKINF